jgi:hypothetical protein
MKEYYELLGLTESATDEEIENRYKELREKYREARWQDGEAGNEASRMLTKIETAYAEIMHIYSAPLGFILLLFAPGALKWTIALPVILVNFFLQIPPVLVQRYNRHRLQKLYALQLRKKARAEAAATNG